MRRGRLWGVGAGLLLFGAVGGFLSGVLRDRVPEVTVGPRAAGAAVSPARGALVVAWTAEPEKAGRGLPDGWEVLTTAEVRDRYSRQKATGAPTAEGIDPDGARGSG
ncbi:hypothetical protein [Streptomyces sp. NPDC089795]|uniref:hypothetical protein n=1 Tax=Streptomyces sp. NPDC089795 TaxID=3155297 RepID=UPI00342E3D4B